MPTARQALRVLFYNMRVLKLSRRESARRTVTQILSYWQKTKIPHIQPVKIQAKLEALYSEWRDIVKCYKRNASTQIRRREGFTSKMDLLFDITDVDAKGLFDVCIFIVKVYIHVWFVSPLATSAPRNDLLFLKKLIEYESTYTTVA